MQVKDACKTVQCLYNHICVAIQSHCQLFLQHRSYTYTMGIPQKRNWVNTGTSTLVNTQLAECEWTFWVLGQRTGLSKMPETVLQLEMGQRPLDPKAQRVPDGDPQVSEDRQGGLTLETEEGTRNETQI